MLRNFYIFLVASALCTRQHEPQHPARREAAINQIGMPDTAASGSPDPGGAPPSIHSAAIQKGERMKRRRFKITLEDQNWCSVAHINFTVATKTLILASLSGTAIVGVILEV